MFALLMLINVPICLIILGIAWATMPPKGVKKLSPNKRFNAFLITYRSEQGVRGLIGTTPQTQYWNLKAVGKTDVPGLEQFDQDSLELVWSEDSKVIGLKGRKKDVGNGPRFICMVDLERGIVFGRHRGQGRVMSSAQMARYFDPDNREAVIRQIEAISPAILKKEDSGQKTKEEAENGKDISDTDGPNRLEGKQPGIGANTMGEGTTTVPVP
jgi:hypothetical protein